MNSDRFPILILDDNDDEIMDICKGRFADRYTGLTGQPLVSQGKVSLEQMAASVG